MVEVCRNGKAISYFAAGFTVGLAISTKYPAVFLLPVLVAAHFLGRFSSQSWLRSFFDPKLGIAILGAVIAFLIGTPFALFDSSTFLTHGIRQLAISSGGDVYPYLGWGPWYHLRFSLLYGCGPGILLLAVVGFPIVAKKQIRLAIIVFTFPVIYFIVMSNAQAVFTRYMVPVIPFLCIAAAVATVLVVEKSTSRIQNSRFRVILLVIFINMVLAPSIVRVAQFDALISRTDTRLLALEWLTSNLTARSSIYQSGDRSVILQLPPTVDSLQSSIEELEVRGYNTSIEYRALQLIHEGQQRRHIEGFSQMSYDESLSAFGTETSGVEDLPDYIILFHSPLRFFEVNRAGLDEIIFDSYEEVMAFTSTRTTQVKALYDQQDALYVPYAGFEGIESPGPNIYIYRNYQAMLREANK